MGNLAGSAPALRTLTSLLHRGIVDAGDVDELLVLYARVLGGRGIAVGQHFGFQPWSAVADVDPSWIDFHTVHRHLDPSAAFLAAAPAGTSFVASRHFTPHERGSPLYRGFVQHELEDALIQRFLTPWAEEVFLVTYRRKGMGELSRDDLALAYLLHPHVGGALATRAALHAISGGLGPSLAPAGHAFVGFPRMEVELSPGARRLFARTLDVTSERGWQRVERLVERAAIDFHGAAPGSRSRVVVPGIRAEHAWVPARDGETHRALVLFFPDPEGCTRAPAPIAEILSPTQRRVARLAASGATNREIAGELGIGLETVRTHLREVFHRLGVSRRAELAALLASAELEP